MQVTKTADFITHALIGGRKTTEFKISGDAAMFNMLSAGLYSDQKLAVAREVLCNSWDSHIRAGKTDCPIIVSITEDKIIIRDAGAGIHDDMMEPLYCTYGGTDKTNNGEETGGFGLGCKSPFSYNDHFEVISWHAGFKTIYNISKSSAEKMGKPGMTSILSFPCGEETGLQVTIPLKNYSDGASFIKLFESIAFNGEMNVLINGALVKNLELSSSESNWVITDTEDAQILLGRALSGDHEEPIEEVIITKQKGGGLKIIPWIKLSKAPEALPVVEEPKIESEPTVIELLPVAEVAAFTKKFEEAIGLQPVKAEVLPEEDDVTKLSAPKVDPKAIAKQVTAIKAEVESRAAKTKRLYADALDSPKAAQILLDHKKATKLGWVALGLPEDTGTKLALIIKSS